MVFLGWTIRDLAGPAHRLGRVKALDERCRLGAVFGVECRPGCRYMPLYAAICRSLERKLLVFLGFVFSSQAEGRRTHRRQLCVPVSKYPVSLR